MVRERLMIVGLALFVAVDLFLVTLAVRHAQAPPSLNRSSQQRAAGSSPQGRSTTAKTSPGDQGSASSAAGTAPVGYLAVGEDRTLLRATRGNCFASQTATVAVSTDQGKTFAAASVPGLTEVLGLRVGPARDLAVIGLGKRCRVSRFTSDDSGQTWKQGPEPGDTWHLSARAGASEVASPEGITPTPCLPVSVSTVNDSLVRILCQNGRILGTDDVGATWVTLGMLSGAVDIRFLTSGEGVAVARRPGCRAAVLRSFNGGASWSKLGCLPGTPPLAIGGQGKIIAVQAGDRLYLSTDAGSTWSPAAAG